MYDIDPKVAALLIASVHPVHMMRGVLNSVSRRDVRINGTASTAAVSRVLSPTVVVVAVVVGVVVPPPWFKCVYNHIHT